MSWNSLPSQVRDTILTRLSETERHPRHSFSRYATVCKDWQHNFEKVIFSKLRVSASDASSFSRVFRIKRRRKYLQHLGLSLNLPEHEYTPFHGAGGSDEEKAMAQIYIISHYGHCEFAPSLKLQEKQNNISFTKAIWVLLSVLRSWKRTQVRHGINLEIIADTKSYWQNMGAKMRRDNGPMAIFLEDSPRDSDGQKRYRRMTLSPHERTPILVTAQLDFHSSLDFDFLGSPVASVEALPKVDVVTSLSILQRTVRHFQPGAIGAIIKCFPFLAKITWQSWPLPHYINKDAFSLTLAKTMSCWPASLEEVCLTHVTFFEYPNRCSRGRHGHNLYPGLFSGELSFLSQRLKRLTVNYTIDAITFLTEAPQQWPKLEQLVLRSKQWILDELPLATNEILLRAAFAASGMPSLKLFGLWSANRTKAGCLTYARQADACVLDVRCSWMFTVDGRCLAAWQDVAMKHSERDLNWAFQRLSAGQVKLDICKISPESNANRA
ncbi:hypothetical protein EDB81DRAFT_918732 [Dactylonectria macrodidyma]|uniref:DUF6546 domain-containing protein n=1 Tax=Dactylonectria macrodidyma TaxID=307937 RepID=A0A9P9JKB5_9HYPO|nr:hypothetical protein EDB81DRAFT_918732 [Dactylonectria macrodidyma]